MASCVGRSDTPTWRPDEENAVLFKSPISQVLGYAIAALLDRVVHLFWLHVDAFREARRPQRGTAGPRPCSGVQTHGSQGRGTRR